MSILTGECAILAAAILWKARTRPRTLRAFLEARFPVDASFRDLPRGLSVSGEGARDSPVAVSRSLPSGEPVLTVSAWDARVICSDDRSGQLWKPLGGGWRPGFQALRARMGVRGDEAAGPLLRVRWARRVTLGGGRGGQNGVRVGQTAALVINQSKVTSAGC